MGGNGGGRLLAPLINTPLLFMNISCAIPDNSRFFNLIRIIRCQELNPLFCGQKKYLSYDDSFSIKIKYFCNHEQQTIDFRTLHLPWQYLSLAGSRGGDEKGGCRQWNGRVVTHRVSSHRTMACGRFSETAVASATLSFPSTSIFILKVTGFGMSCPFLLYLQKKQE